MMNLGPNEMMMDLFRSEVETHSEALASALLQLERNPGDTSCYDSMMRAAHSIKGAARIVRVEEAVELSHALEDCFVAAQRGELEIKPTDFDLFLGSVDLLTNIAESTKLELEERTSRSSPHLHRIVNDLKSLRGGKRNEPLSQTPTEKKVQAPAPENERRVLRKIIGRFDQDAAELIRQWLLGEMQKDRMVIELDLSGTTDLDPVSLVFLASAREFVAKNSTCRLVYMPISEQIKMVFEATGIS